MLDIFDRIDGFNRNASLNRSNRNDTIQESLKPTQTILLLPLFLLLLLPPPQKKSEPPAREAPKYLGLEDICYYLTLQVPPALSHAPFLTV